MAVHIKKTILYIIIVLICLITLYPYFVMLTTALKSRAEIFNPYGTVFPIVPLWGNLTKIWKLAPMGR